MARFSATTVAALVVLRLLCGWHFYNEGVKKLDGGFSSAGFLRTAKGPFAPMFESMAPGPYGAYATLGKAVEAGSLDAETAATLSGWEADYGRRAAAAIKGGKPFPIDYPAEASFAPWIDRMAEGWDEGIERLARLGVGEDELAAVRSARETRLGQAVNYLHGESATLADMQHQAWRLEQMRERSDGVAPPPYERGRIAEKETEVWRNMQPLVRNIQQVEQDWIADTVAATGSTGASAERIKAAVTERTLLSWVDMLVIGVVLGSGICLFLGFGTRVAAIAAAGFLVSLIMTQPPWVAGADIQAFFTWAVEAAALCVLAATGAGRWLGLDGLIHRLRTRFGDLAPQNQPPAPRLAA